MKTAVPILFLLLRAKTSDGLTLSLFPRRKKYRFCKTNCCFVSTSFCFLSSLHAFFCCCGSKSFSHVDLLYWEVDNVHFRGTEDVCIHIYIFIYRAHVCV
uniref:Putative secreted protein n=1 Tax=Ixodes ricinus TaxID=34613 RepID=A0A6B0U8E2_IXORI